jgi:branched-chain amino acid transport system permease protein
LFGVIALCISAIGMVETFDGVDIITGVLTLGQVLLFVSPLIAGYLAFTRARVPQLAVQAEIDPTSTVDRHGDNKTSSSDPESGGDSVRAIAGGLIAGVLAGLPLVGLIILWAIWPDIRDALVNVTDELVNILTFGLEPAIGSVVLLIVMAVLGMLGALFRLLPRRIERPILVGILTTVTFGLFADIFRNILEGFSPRSVIRFFFGSAGIKPLTAVIIFVIAAGANAWWNTRGRDRYRHRFTASGGQSPRSRLIVRILLVLLILALPWILGIYLTNVVDQVGLFILMGLGLNIVVGYAGLLDLGYVAFFAIGAYMMGLLTSTGDLGLGLSFWIALPVSVAAAATAGILLGVPVLRMRGDYLAIVTLGFGEIIRVLVASDLLKPVIGGAQGIIRIGRPGFFGLDLFQGLRAQQHYYYLILAGVVLAIFVSSRLRDARLGRQWMALREDEDVAEAMGINLVKTKLLAFSIGAAFGGLAGGIFASRLNSIFPNSFALLISINVLSLIIVGGIGSIPGVILGALVLVGLPELLTEFSEYRLLIYGAVLVATMILRPEGLWPSPIRKRELHADEDDEEIAAREGPMHEEVHDLV